MTAILNYAGSGSPLGSLNYSVEGLPSSGHSLALTGNQAFALAIWNEATIWNAAAARDIGSRTYEVTVNLGATYASAAVYDPMTGAMPIRTYGPTNAVQVNLTDHPVIVEIRLAGATVPPPSRHQP
jgi:hypothetical protein